MKTFKTISLAIMIMIVGVATVDARNYGPTTVHSESTPIKIYPKPIEVPSQPRTLGIIPFYAELTAIGVLLVADRDWGEANVTLSSIEGDYYNTTFDMTDASILLPVNGNIGDSYTLTISVCGLEYEGEFYL